VCVCARARVCARTCLCVNRKRLFDRQDIDDEEPLIAQALAEASVGGQRAGAGSADQGGRGQGGKGKSAGTSWREKLRNKTLRPPAVVDRAQMRAVRENLAQQEGSDHSEAAEGEGQAGEECPGRQGGSAASEEADRDGESGEESLQVRRRPGGRRRVGRRVRSDSEEEDREETEREEASPPPVPRRRLTQANSDSEGEARGTVEPLTETEGEGGGRSSSRRSARLREEKDGTTRVPMQDAKGKEWLPVGVLGRRTGEAGFGGGGAGETVASDEDVHSSFCDLDEILTLVRVDFFKPADLCGGDIMLASADVSATNERVRKLLKFCEAHAPAPVEGAAEGVKKGYVVLVNDGKETIVCGSPDAPKPVWLEALRGIGKTSIVGATGDTSAVLTSRAGLHLSGDEFQNLCRRVQNSTDWDGYLIYER
jgi:hypothetical protein